MSYVDIFRKFKTEDERIEFSVVDDDKIEILEGMPDFYQEINPINVEFEFNDGIVRLYRYDELDMAQKEYQYVSEGFVFASCNGEPIYYKNGKVFTCVCGKEKIIEEQLAESIDIFFAESN